MRKCCCRNVEKKPTAVSHPSAFYLPQPKLTPQLTPRRPLNLADQRSSLMFESCETMSITSLGNSHVASACGHTHVGIEHSITHNVWFVFVPAQGQRKICSMMLRALPSAIDPSSQTIPCRYATQTYTREKVSSRKIYLRTWLTSSWHLKSVRYREVQRSDIDLCPIILLVPLHALFPVSSLFV